MLNVFALLNLNARGVNKNIIKKMRYSFPKMEIFVSRNIVEAEEIVQKALSRGFRTIICGGGDGTVLSIVNIVVSLSEKFPIKKIRISVLPLGTGNALAKYLRSSKDKIEENIHSLYIDANNKKWSLVKLPLIKCIDGKYTVFTGVGADGELINKFNKLFKNKSKIIKYLFKNVIGYLMISVFNVLPKYFIRKYPGIVVTTTKDAYYVVKDKFGLHKLKKISVNKGEEKQIFKGFSLMTALSTITFFGYGIKMFPFAGEKRGFANLRICSESIFKVMYNGLKFWRGTYNGPGVFDFLVKDVRFELNVKEDCHVTGESLNVKVDEIFFKVSGFSMFFIKYHEE